MIRVLIVEDQAILRESLARSVGDQPDMTVVAAIADASRPWVSLKERPTLILMDVCTEHDSNGHRGGGTHQGAAARVSHHYQVTGMPEITFVDQAREAGVPIAFVSTKNVGIGRAVRRDALHVGWLLTFPSRPRAFFRV